MTGEQDTDLALVERVQKGDKRAFDLLVRKYQHKVVGVISRYINDWSECRKATSVLLTCWCASISTR